VKVPKGFLLSAVKSGIKKDKFDLGLIYCPDFAKVIGFFTTNANPSYSVILSKKNINHPIKAIIVNSGNANCFYKNGLKDTYEIAEVLSTHLGIKRENVLFASTGIIGKKIPKKKIIKHIPTLIKNLNNNEEAIKNFSSSILTTDTFKKIFYTSFFTKRKRVSILGMAKGAGMIFPHLATMLGFILTDAKIDTSLFKKETKKIIEESFNSISVDGCVSTNDTVFFLMSNKIVLEGKDRELFFKKVREVCLELAKMIVKDAEGSTKFVEILIKGAKNKEEAKRAAQAVANSNLFRCTLYGEVPNWGRAVASLGQAKIKLEENVIIKSTSLKKDKIRLNIDLKRGNFSWRFFCSDLTPQYIKLNAQP
jgi:glutamate N-acetyltransferase/amino-acid N-acetyltransferase